MKLVGYKKITANIELITGLHIGGSEEASQIGAIDNPVIRLQKNGYPYIPGSSLKGKMRSLLELVEGKTTGDPCSCGKCNICILFGSTNKESNVGPARLIFSDLYIDEINNINSKIKEQSKGFPFSEEKTEVVIDRIKGSAKNGGLRKIERIPAGVTFNMEIRMRVFDTDDNLELENFVKKGINLLELDAIGGSVSRGYGRIKFNELSIESIGE